MCVLKPASELDHAHIITKYYWAFSQLGSDSTPVFTFLHLKLDLLGALFTPSVARILDLLNNGPVTEESKKTQAVSIDEAVQQLRDQLDVCKDVDIDQGRVPGQALTRLLKVGDQLAERSMVYKTTILSERKNKMESAIAACATIYKAKSDDNPCTDL